MKKKSLRSLLAMAAMALICILLSGCLGPPEIASPDKMQAPEPIYGNSGKYMCPYTSDGVMSEWTDNAVNAGSGAMAGQIAGTLIGQQALEQVPFIGGILGGHLGKAAGRAIAIKACGGWDYIQSTSDLSFDDLNDMAIYLYVKHSSHEHYDAVIKATGEIYPDFHNIYTKALLAASK